MKEFKDLSFSLELLAESLYDKVVEEAKNSIKAKNATLNKETALHEVEQAFNSLDDCQRMVMYCHQVMLSGENSDFSYDEDALRDNAIQALADAVLED